MIINLVVLRISYSQDRRRFRLCILNYCMSRPRLSDNKFHEQNRGSVEHLRLGYSQRVLQALPLLLTLVDKSRYCVQGCWQDVRSMGVQGCHSSNRRNLVMADVSLVLSCAIMQIMFQLLPINMISSFRLRKRIYLYFTLVQHLLMLFLKVPHQLFHFKEASRLR